MHHTPIISITKMNNNYLASVANYSLYGYNSKYNLINGKTYESNFFYYVIIEILFIKFSEYIITKNLELE
ncbi:hypothetical protein AN641_08410 [Candidatus Epulonipiscioides gigas]|nr:hypothetical protein AN641_08410 [Epulopiscium sp. SCG-C07WGA-EpuloA2]